MLVIKKYAKLYMPEIIIEIGENPHMKTACLGISFFFCPNICSKAFFWSKVHVRKIILKEPDDTICSTKSFLWVFLQ